MILRNKFHVDEKQIKNLTIYIEIFHEIPNIGVLFLSPTGDYKLQNGNVDNQEPPTFLGDE